jgi:hypothetical protein
MLDTDLLRPVSVGVTASSDEQALRPFLNDLIDDFRVLKTNFLRDGLCNGELFFATGVDGRWGDNLFGEGVQGQLSNTTLGSFEVAKNASIMKFCS